MKAMETVQDLIEEAKLRTVWWALCIFAISYFLTHTSKSMWMNIPIAILLASGLRILLNEVEFRWKVRKSQRPTYLSHLEKKQLSANDSRLSTSPPAPKWKRKIDSPIVEAALEDFINKLLQDFVVDLWYSEITPDKEAPDLIHAIVMDVLGEVSARVKEINLVDLLTRDVVDLISDHLDLFRRTQSAIGVDVMGTLSSEERDERLKHHLLSFKELHPALISSESEYKFLQQLMSGVIAVVLRPRESQCPLVRCFARELLTCLVMQPVMNLASPLYINQVLEIIFTALKDGGLIEAVLDPTPKGDSQDWGHVFTTSSAKNSEYSTGKDVDPEERGNLMFSSLVDKQKGVALDIQDSSLSNPTEDEPMRSRPGDWARVLEAATQRRTEVLMPENLENMWTIGRNYKKKLQKNAAKGIHASGIKDPVNSSMPVKNVAKEVPVLKPQISNPIDDRSLMQLLPRPDPDNELSGHNINTLLLSQDVNNEAFLQVSLADDRERPNLDIINENTSGLKRSSSTSDLKVQPVIKNEYADESGPIIAEYYSADSSRRNEVHSVKNVSDRLVQSEASHAPKLKCRVVGAFFEKLGSKSFAVYSIAVTDADNKTWFVKRRYRNFERLHRHLKDIPNYTLHLPPKRIFSSSTEDAFVHQRCIQLDKYLQDLLSIANVAEQHEVWDFLSASSKNYSFGKSSSVMRTLAVNVDDAMDDIVRQFRGVSDGLMRKVVGSPTSASSVAARQLSWNVAEMNKLALTQSSESVNSFSDNEDGYKDGSQGHEDAESGGQANGWHSDNELNSKSFPPRVVKRDEEFGNLDCGKKHDSGDPSKSQNPSKTPESSLFVISDRIDDPIGVPPEWTPPNLSLPVLNLVDNVFQLKKRGWLRRQVFWISKQILQLMMEDAIDDWLLRQIHWLRRDDVVAYGIRWLQNLLWPDGTFFLKLNVLSGMDNSQPNQEPGQTPQAPTRTKISRPGSFEQQLEASRRANDVKKMLFDGAPTALVSLIGNKQYRRCARDLYYFLQSTICLKQVAYAILELVLVSIFPELRDLVIDIHEKMRAEHVQGASSLT